MGILEIKDTCIQCGSCLGCNYDFLCALPDGSIKVNEGTFLEDDSNEFKTLKEICPIDAFVLNKTTEKKKILMEILDELTHYSGIAMPTKEDISFISNMYYVDLSPLNGEYKYDYTSETAAEKAALSEFNRTIYSKLDNIIAKIITEYRINIIRPYYIENMDEGSVYAKSNKKVSDLLKAIKKILGNNLPEGFEFVNVFPNGNTIWKMLNKGELISDDMVPSVLAEYDHPAEQYSCYWNVESMETTTTNFFNHRRTKILYCYCCPSIDLLWEVRKDILNACNYAKNNIESRALELIANLVNEYNETLKKLLEKKIADINSVMKNIPFESENTIKPELTESEKKSMLEIAEKYYLNCEFEKAEKNFRILAENNNARAMYFLGEIYTQGYGKFKKDIVEGTKWRRKGYELGDVLSSLNAAETFDENSKEREQLWDKMFFPVKKLSENGDCFAQADLGLMYMLGLGCESNDIAAKEWLYKSSENGFWRATYDLAEFLYEENCFEEAIQLYEKAANMGYSEAMNALGNMYYRGCGVEQSYEMAKMWYIKAGKNGSAWGYKNIADMYYCGIGVVNDNYEAFEFCRKSAELGLAEAQNTLGVMYYEGKGVIKDYQLAFKWYEKAAKQENDYGIWNLANCYFHGEGVNKNRKYAIELYIHAAEMGNSSAQNTLGNCYLKGEGVLMDETKAFYWIEKAAQNENPTAQNNLSYLYETGKGVEKNLELANIWKKRAEENGYAN